MNDNFHAVLYDEDVFRLFGLRPSRKTPYTDITHTKDKPRKKVKRPMNSFMAFSFFERKKICSENPKIHNAEVSRKLGDLWKHTSCEQKRLFEKIAKILKIYHEMEFPDYKYKPKKKPKQLPGAVLKKPVRKRPTKKFLSSKENVVRRPSSVASNDLDYECSSNPDNEHDNYTDATANILESVLTPPSSAPMTPESAIEISMFQSNADNFSVGVAQMTSHISANNLLDTLPLEGDSAFMTGTYESESSSSSLTFSSPSEFQPFTENQLMEFDPLTDEDLLQ